MEKANAFINSLDNSENFKICEFEPKDKLLVKVKSTTEFFSDGSPVIKTFFKSPLINYVFQPSKKYQIIWNESDEVMYWYDDDNQTWYYCTMIYEIEDLLNQVNLYICENCGEQVDATYTCEDCGKEICFNCAYTTNLQCKCPDCYERKDLLAEIARIGILNCENKTSKELIDIINNYYKKIVQI